jgi:hypothetical protein
LTSRTIVNKIANPRASFGTINLYKKLPPENKFQNIFNFNFTNIVVLHLKLLT